MTEITQADHKAAEKAQWDAVVRVDSLAEAFARHREKAAAEERAKIVAWLREQQVSIEKLRDAMNRFTAGWHFADQHASALEQAANDIEAGEHETFTHPDNV
jgi:hypothetical protein